jgi:hypothetical protein
MPKWLRRTAGTLTLGGSAVGIALIALALLSSPQPIGTLVVYGLFIALFAVGIVVGVWLLESDRRGVVWGVPYWCLQIPLVSSSLISYQFATGAFINVAVTGDAKLQFNAQVGSNFTFVLLSDAPLLIGVNVFAVAMSVLLWKRRGSL